MPPAKSSRNNNHDEHHKLEVTGKEKNGHTATKMRRGASQQTAAARELPPPPTSVPMNALAEASAPAVSWTSFERRSLHAYIREHDLNTPRSYVSAYHNWILACPGSLGHYSPTMIRKRKFKRQSKDQLALAVRKHFNDLGIQENDVVVDFIYKTRNDKMMQYDGPNKHSMGLID